MDISPHLISFVASSKRRLEVLKILDKESRSQPEIMKLTGMYKAHTSRTLKELFEKGLIICRNPEDRVFKFYKITNAGKKIIKEVENILEN
jgi:predicted transcriptional regulator